MNKRIVQKIKRIQAMSSALQDEMMRRKRQDDDIYDDVEGQMNDVTEACLIALEMIALASSGSQPKVKYDRCRSQV